MVGASVAVLALVGRYTGALQLATWATPQARVRPMQVLTAISFLGFASSILLGVRRTPRLPGRVLSRLLALASGGMGLTLFLVQRNLITLPGWLRVRTLVSDISSGEEPGIPASNEVVVLLLFAAAVLLLTYRRPILVRTGQALALGVVVIGGVVTVAFFYGDDTLAGFPFGSGRMAVSAAVIAMALALAAMLARPEAGFMAPLASPWSGGILLRRLLPLVLTVPPAAVALMLTGLSGASQRPRLLAWLAVVASILLAVGLFATAASVNRAGISLQTAHDLSDRAVLAVKHDADLADKLRGLLVRLSADPTGSLEYAVRYRPAEGWLAGDAAAIQPLDDSRLGMAIVDVAGHGRVPALTAFRMIDLVLHAMKGGMAPARAVASLLWVLEPSEEMATAVIAELDSGSGVMRYVVAGHPPVLIRRVDGSVDRLDPTGPVLFSGLSGRWDERLVVLEEGDTLVIYTDGVADPQEAERAEVATVRHLTEAVRRFPSGGAEELAEWCLSEASGRARGRLKDDATVVVVRRKQKAVERT